MNEQGPAATHARHAAASGASMEDSGSPIDAVAGVSSGAASSRATSGGIAGRSSFDAFELAMVLSHFPLSTIRRIQDFPRGSRKAPKLIVQCEDAIYLLKRRAQSKGDAEKVAFSHSLQLHLSDKQFPLPHLIGTRKNNNSMLKLNDYIYELFEYIKSTGYDQSLEATGDSGRIMALFHKLLRDFKCDYQTPRGSYHNAPSVFASLKAIPQRLLSIQQGAEQDIERIVSGLHAAYQKAVDQIEGLGFSQWPQQLIHSDWHSGNVLFRGTKVVAVIDFDAARYQQRMIDVANGALQFSVLGGGDDPAAWPDYLDESRYKRFLRGYEAVPDCVLSTAELQTIPWLMIQALVAEATIPIAATGYFGRMPGLSVLSMVHRKVAWLQKSAELLVNAVES